MLKCIKSIGYQWVLKVNISRFCSNFSGSCSSVKTERTQRLDALQELFRKNLKMLPTCLMEAKTFELSLKFILLYISFCEDTERGF